MLSNIASCSGNAGLIVVQEIGSLNVDSSLFPSAPPEKSLDSVRKQVMPISFCHSQFISDSLPLDCTQPMQFRKGR
jgi:hypothetical protein